VFSALEYSEGSGVPGLHPYAGLGRSRLCLRFIHDSGILDRYPCKAWTFPALPPRLGRSRPYPSIRVRVFPALSPSFIPEISTVSETAHHGPRPFKRAVQSTRRVRPAAGRWPTDSRCYRARRHGSTCASSLARVPQ